MWREEKANRVRRGEGLVMDAVKSQYLIGAGFYLPVCRIPSFPNLSYASRLLAVKEQVQFDDGLTTHRQRYISFSYTDKFKNINTMV